MSVETTIQNLDGFRKKDMKLLLIDERVPCLTPLSMDTVSSERTSSSSFSHPIIIFFAF